VVIGNLDIVRIAVSPDEAHPPLFINSERMLALTLALEHFERETGLGGFDRPKLE
jgi:hypothetical protein